MVLSNCPSCGAPPRFVNVAKEPGTDRSIVFCGKCRKVLPSTPGEIPPGLDHLSKFVADMSQVLIKTSGIEVVSATFTEGIKAGVNLALSVPWSEKEAFWMEKYGVAQRERVRGLKKMIADLEQLEKTAGDGGISSNRQQLLEQYKKELQEIESKDKDGISQ